jgi:hypothetical protein
MSKQVRDFVTAGNYLISSTHTGHVTEMLKGSGGDLMEREECLLQIDRLISDPLLQHSEGLCKLLQYLAQHTLNFPADHLKEYKIAIEVFGRSSDFDPQSDSSVRVQVGRLRTKLAEYYKSADANDLILVEVPKGGYNLSFRRRISAPEPESPPPLESNPIGPALSAHPPRRVVIGLAILTGALLVAGVLAYGPHRNRALTAVVENETVRTPAALRSFWSPFLSAPEDPFVIFSNATFVGNAETGMRYFDPSRDSHDQTTEHYTGVGEVMGVLELDRVLWQLGRRFRIKRGGLFTLDDARNNNLIFVGSPTENLTLGEIPNTRDFVFRRLPSGRKRWQEAIVDLHPQPGEKAIFLPTPQTKPMKVDYAVIALMHGLDRARWTLILAGASTVGTQAAVDYVCNKSSLEDLLHRLNAASGAGLKPFEALLKVDVANDVPLETQLMDVRKTQ